MTRNTKGIIGWSALAFLFGIIVLLPMIGREYYQYKIFNLKEFEWGDIVRYGLFIAIFSLFHWCICDLINLPIWTMF